MWTQARLMPSICGARKKPLGIKQFIKLIVLNNAVSHMNAACLRVLAHHTNGRNADAKMILTTSCNY